MGVSGGPRREEPEGRRVASDFKRLREPALLTHFSERYAENGDFLE
jgi:hypothetical protein